MTAVWESTLPMLPVVRNTGERSVMATIEAAQDQHRAEADHPESDAQEAVPAT